MDEKTNATNNISDIEISAPIKEIDISSIEKGLNATINWASENLFVWNTVIQLGIIAAVALSCIFFLKWIRPTIEKWLQKLKLSWHMLIVAARLLPLFLFTPILWIITAVLHRTWQTQTHVLDTAANISLVWIVTQLSGALIRNRIMGRIISVAAFCLAVLNITDLLNPTTAILDSMAITFGATRISLLNLVTGTIWMWLLLWGALAIARSISSRISKVSDLTPSLQVLVSKLISITLTILAIVIALDSVGIDLSGLAIFTGAVGVGIGIGLQKTVSNLLSGVILLLDKSVKPGDVIEIDGTFGWVNEMGARYVSIVTRSRKEYLVPNEDLITNQVVNWSHSDTLLRLEIPFSVSYNSNPHKVRETALKAVLEPDRVVESPKPKCLFVEFGESTLDFLLRFWIKDPQGGVRNIKAQVNLCVWDALKENGIEIPYPTRELHTIKPLKIELEKSKPRNTYSTETIRIKSPVSSTHKPTKPAKKETSENKVTTKAEA